MIEDNTHNNQWISFSIENELYAVPVRTVQEISPYTQPEPVPGAPDEVVGILNIRGEVVTIVSGRKLLNKRSPVKKTHSNIMVLYSDTGLIGVCVDQMGQMLTIETEKIEKNPEQIREELFFGTFFNNNQLVILLDISSFIQKKQPTSKERY